MCILALPSSRRRDWHNCLSASRSSYRPRIWLLGRIIKIQRSLELQRRATDSDTTNSTLRSLVVTPVSSSCGSETIRLFIRVENSIHCQISTAPATRPHESRILAVFSGALISGHDVFTGDLLGVYASTNGGNHTLEGHVSRWRYTPIAQQIDFNEFIISPGF